MPCNSDHMKQTPLEAEYQLVAQLYAYVLTETGLRPGTTVEETANDYYARADFTDQLCTMIRRMSQSELARIVYAARNKDARRLADWWEAHQAADRDRERDEAKSEADRKLRAAALAKLTPEERRVLGVREDK